MEMIPCSTKSCDKHLPNYVVNRSTVYTTVHTFLDSPVFFFMEVLCVHTIIIGWFNSGICGWFSSFLKHLKLRFTDMFLCWWQHEGKATCSSCVLSHAPVNQVQVSPTHHTNMAMEVMFSVELHTSQFIQLCAVHAAVPCWPWQLVKHICHCHVIIQ